MNPTALLVQLIACALGGYAAASVSKEMNLGTIGNSVASAMRGARNASHWVSEIEDLDLRRLATGNVS